jgi:hypothetical protein
MSFARCFRGGIVRALGVVRASGVGRLQLAPAAFSVCRRSLATAVPTHASTGADSSDYQQALNEELERVQSQRTEWLAALKRAAADRNSDAALQLVGNMRAVVRRVIPVERVATGPVVNSRCKRWHGVGWWRRMGRAVASPLTAWHPAGRSAVP